jgi:hypothetical protein
MDMAASIQAVTEVVVMWFARSARAVTGQCNLCTEIEVLAIGNCFLCKEEQDLKLELDYKNAFELD